MTTFKLNLITAAAALIAASATASAQNTLSANVPFDFKISSRTVLPAGDYAILHEDAGFWVFENRESGYKATAALGTAQLIGVGLGLAIFLDAHAAGRRASDRTAARFCRKACPFRTKGDNVCVQGHGRARHPQPKPKDGSGPVSLLLP